MNMMRTNCRLRGMIFPAGTDGLCLTRRPGPVGWRLLLVLLVLSGCGYRPVGTESLPVEKRPTIAIPPFGNRTTEIGLETMMANAFINTFAQNRGWRVVTRPEEADLVLEGKVSSIESSSVAFFDINRSLVRRVTIRVDLQLTRKSGGKVIWKESDVFQEDYAVDNNYQIGEATKAMGIRRGAATLARRVMDKVMMVI
ncbi:MAG: hypothetical protein FJ128_02225 [Deltaproteobacteria bacterium]|nr:hypothetical protein [Deltaproteobacteria bacterium]